MKIFYGIQGTGNGHITRGRIMARELQAADLEVTYLFTGRPQDKFFAMDVFNGNQWREGLTFATHKGKINHLKTVLQSKPLNFLKDIRQLDLSAYDLVICDFEPVKDGMPPVEQSWCNRIWSEVNVIPVELS